MDEPALSLLVAAIGTSDVKLPVDAVRAEYLDPTGKSPFPARTVGAAILARIDAGEVIDYDAPLLRPVLDTLRASGQRPARIVLLATDQPEHSAGRHYLSDTLHYAELVRRLLCTRYEYPREAIEIVRYRDNPAEYDAAFCALRALFARLRDSGTTTWDACYLALTAGTPALTAALLSEGGTAFGARAQAYYVPRGSERAYSVNVARDLHAQTLRRALLTHIAAHAYAAAAALCDADPAACATLLPDPTRRALVRALLSHAAHRLNANLAGAQAATADMDTTLLGFAERDALALAATGATERERDARTVREVIASAEVMYEHEHYFDFITRAGTFLDTGYKYIARHCFGAEPRPQPDKPAKPSLGPWIREHPDLESYLRGKKPPVKFDDVPSQYVYKMVIAFYAKQGDATQKALHKAVSAKRLNDLAELRNASVHRFDEITSAKLHAVWGADPATIIPELRRIATLAGIEQVEPNPYRVIQQALHRLLA